MFNNIPIALPNRKKSGQKRTRFGLKLPRFPKGNEKRVRPLKNRLDKLAAAIETGTDDGMINFNQALFQLVKDGKVSEKEALAKATNPQALEMNFKGIFLDEGRRILS